ncbi:hypothetical protein EHS13_10290 [Paenibacillus psychroresistens]|uniref:Uncharacterized protein n=1 Tax=Paenibacillus psychroresistens TaxID=1778678 RepID=A0A6B8RGL9_9BACL|nr:hypothetical protein [Paenibacillus psychroresistens]QGQ95249.1 hypothetical protein EHS13_10290 [Paenibacillus psychroresistens]
MAAQMLIKEQTHSLGEFQAVEKPRTLRIRMLASGTLEFASFFIEIKQVVRMQSSKAPRKLFAQHTNPPHLVSQQPFFV